MHNLRPRAARKLALDYDSVRAQLEDIVYCGAYGFGADGPYGDKAAYDDLIQGISGLPSITQDSGGQPRYVPINLADRVTGLHAVYAVTAALFARERTGQG